MLQKQTEDLFCKRGRAMFLPAHDRYDAVCFEVVCIKHDSLEIRSRLHFS